MQRFLALIPLIMASMLPAQAAPDAPTLFQQPTLSKDRIVFAYAGDLWNVSRDGGQAVHLTTHAGVEADPQFSPDGSMVAFTGQYDGNTDVYIIGVGGGEPRRLTYHPGRDQAVGWTPDGNRVLFRSARESTAGYARLYTQSVKGGMPVAVPLPLAFEGALAPDGERLAYQPTTQWQPDWKRHLGGQAGRIWIARLSDSSIQPVPRESSNDTNPQWLGDTIYFLSDRDGAVTIFAHDAGSGQVSRVLDNEGLDIKSMAAGPDALVYEQFGTLHLLDPATGAGKQIDIQVGGDFPGVRPRYEKVGDAIRNGSVSPSGVRAVFEARGEIITVPVEKGDPRNLTRTPGVMERDPAWSPDGGRIAYFSDESGEYALHIRDQKGDGEVRKIDLGEPHTFYYRPVWSPDSKKIAFSDRRLNLWYLDLDTDQKVKVDTNPVGFTGAVLEPHWSPDSSWLTYARYLPNLMRAVFVHELATGTSHAITDGMSDSAYPVFDRSGKYIYFAASTDIGPGLSWADLSGIDHVSTRSIYAVVLPDDLPSPLAPESDEEETGGDEEGEGDAENSKEQDGADAGKDGKKNNTGTASGEDDDGGDKDDEPAPVRIALDSIDQRIIALPVAGGDVRALATAGEGVLFVATVPPAHFRSSDGAMTLSRFDLEKREEESYLSGVRAFQVSADGEKMLFRKGPGWSIAGTAGEPKPGDGGLATGDMEIRVEPMAEWRQMYRDVWLGERDHFYDPGHHGLDLDAAGTFYEPYLAAVAHRADLNYLFREMLNQLTIGHMFIFGGDMTDTPAVGGGLLGCDFEVEGDRYRFQRVFDGENWNPDLQAPLTGPGVNVVAGDHLLAVNGRTLTTADNVHAFFENTAGRQVVLRIAPGGDEAAARDVTVVPVGDESALRNRAWIEDNRRMVHELSGGRLAYIYIPNTGGGGFASFNRYFFSQTDRQGAVVDERFNKGGLLADYVANYLTRPQLSAITFRYAEQDIPVPGGAIYGPKAMLINSMAGSGGDAMPWYFRKMNVGPLIGKRTWGGLVASQQGPRLMDGGGYTAPDAAVYGLDGEWEVENAGVAPDIDVELDPAAWRQGRDTQIEKAVEVLLDDLERHPPRAITRPDYPVYERCCGLDQK